MAMLTRPGGKQAREESGPSLHPNPSVNLLPNETVERQRAHAVVRRFVLAAVSIAAVGAGVWLAQSAAIEAAEDDLAAAESQLAEVRGQLEPLEPVKAFSATLAERQELIGTSMAKHTSFSRAMDGFADAWPAGSSLRTLDASLGSGCAGPDVFEPAPSIGCITWTVTVSDEQQVRELTDSLETSPGLVSPYLTGAVKDEEKATFDASGTVNFDKRLRTGRFADLLKEVAK